MEGTTMTRIHNVHEREIAAPAAVVGEILDSVGSADDRLWATDIWVAEPVVFDRPLGVGASGGHGSIRYSVLEYEPSRRIVFEFSPGGGLSGTHRFELEPLGADRCRLRHVLEAETSRWMRPLEPILIGWHDAMVETALDRAELGATGSLERRTRIPRWLRIVNGAEIAIGRALGRIPPAAGRDGGRLPLGYRMIRPAGILVPAALGAIAAIHAAWALGWRWPGGTDDALADIEDSSAAARGSSRTVLD
jgi:Polyketide cyclase / dehydrase and lipid transport